MLTKVKIGVELVENKHLDPNYDEDLGDFDDKEHVDAEIQFLLASNMP